MPAQLVAHPSGVTASQHSFAQIPGINIQRSVFDRSSSVKTAFNSGYLVPFLCDEALPGDTFNLRTTAFCRLSTPIFPVMDNLYMDVFFFSVPIRLIWDNFQKFMGEQRNPGDSIDYLTPVLSDFAPAENSLSDYMGLPKPPAAGNLVGICSFWHRAYNLIWNEWFRDQNMQNSVVVDTDDGPDDVADYVLLRRGKRHDYFTSSLPFTQKGTVGLPIGAVTGINDQAPTLNIIGDATTYAMRGGAADIHMQITPTPSGVSGNLEWANPALQVVLSNVNDLRNAFQIQKLLERDARGGSRYIEVVQSHFGVTSPDLRATRPEYLGGGSTRINIHPVARTTAGQAPIPTGNLASPAAALGGFGTAGFDGLGFMKSFTEHCVVLGLVNVRADITYQQGVNKMFLRRRRYDFYWPEFAHLGEQAVLNKEIYAQGTAADDLVWGYQERFAEYRYKPSIVSGTMRSTAAAPMDNWHLALNFTALPLLNSVFIPDQPPLSRVLAVTTQPELFGDFFISFRAARPMPTFSVPGLIDHF